MFQAKPKQYVHPVSQVGSLLALAGLAAWIWTGEWKWAATGLLLLLGAGIAGAMLAARKRPDR